MTDSAALEVLGAFCALNLMLTVAMARRLREFGEHLTPLQPGAGYSGDHSSFLLPRGSVAPDFTTTSIDGTQRSRRDLLGKPSLIAFLLTNCPPCHKQVPDLLRYAPTVASPANVLAVISGQGEEADSLASALKGIATVVREEEEPTLGRAFSVEAYPTFYLLDDNGMIQSGAPTIHRLAVRAADRQARHPVAAV